MKKKIFSKKELFKELKIPFRVGIGGIFSFVPLVYVIIDLILYFNSNIVSKKNTIGNLVIDLFILLVFTCFIGLRLILNSVKIVRFINSDLFNIEIDEVIDKDNLSTNAYSNTVYRVILKHNKGLLPRNEWNSLKIGSKCYVFNILDKETIIKDTSIYNLDDELLNRVSCYHAKPENTVEKCE